MREINHLTEYERRQTREALARSEQLAGAKRDRRGRWRKRTKGEYTERDIKVSRAREAQLIAEAEREAARRCA